MRAMRDTVPVLSSRAPIGAPRTLTAFRQGFHQGATITSHQGPTTVIQQGPTTATRQETTTSSQEAEATAGSTTTALSSGTTFKLYRENNHMTTHADCYNF